MYLKLFNRGPSYNELYLFFLQLSMYYGAGHPLRKAIEQLVPRANNPVMKEALKSIIKDSANGNPISDSFGKHKCFPKECSQIIRAGEVSGDLVMCLEVLSGHMKRYSDLIRHIMISISPIILPLILMIASFLIIILYIFPYFEDMYAALDGEIPAFTQITISVYQMVIKYWYLIAGSIISAGLFSWYYVKKNPVAIDYLLLKIPVYKHLHYYYLQAKLSQLFFVYLSAGFNANDMVKYTAESVGNNIIANILRKTLVSMKNGYSLPDALAVNNIRGIIDPTMIDLIRTGMESRTLIGILEKNSKNYKDLTDGKTESFSNDINPYFMTPAFVILVYIIITIFYPMWTMKPGV